MRRRPNPTRIANGREKVPTYAMNFSAKTFQVFSELLHAVLKLIAQCKLHNAWITGEAAQLAEARFGVQKEIDAEIARGIRAAIEVYGVRQIRNLATKLNMVVSSNCKFL